MSEAKATIAVDLSSQSEDVRASFEEIFKSSSGFPVLEFEDRGGDFYLTVDASSAPDSAEAADDYEIINAVMQSISRAILANGGGPGDVEEVLQDLEMDATVLAPEEEESWD